MKKLLLLTTMLFSTAAFAGDNTNNGVGNSITDNNYSTSSKTYNTNDNHNSNSNWNTNVNNNRNTNKQFQAQAQGQQQEANGTNSNNIGYTSRYAASTVFAAPLTAGGESCMGSTSAAGQGVGFGLSLGSTWHDESCERRHDAITIYNMGEHRAALALLCQDENVRKAMLAAGRYCPVENTQDVQKFSNKEEDHSVTKQVTVTDSFPQQPHR